MQNDKSEAYRFEKAFDAFLERTEYDQAENALFSIVRIAFSAGWLAAGGKAPEPQKFFTVLHKIDIPDEIVTDIKVESDQRHDD